MKKSYFAHLSTVVLLHALLIWGTWKLSDTQQVRAKFGTYAMKLNIASQVIVSTPQIQNKPSRPRPKKRSLPSTSSEEQKNISKTDLKKQTLTEGKNFGTSTQGKMNLLSTYTSELRSVIDKHKYYPPLSRRLGQTGTVVVAFTLLEDGHIIDVRIEKPSRYKRLNASALDAVKKVERFRPIPKELGEARMDIKVPLKFFTI